MLMFLNVLLLVVEKLDHLTATKTTQDYLWYCQEGIYNRILEKVTHHASLKGAHKQMWMFTHWFDFVKLGDNLGHHGHDFEDIMSAYMRFTRMDHLTSNVLFGWLLTSRL